MSHSLIAEDINSWATGKYIDLPSHAEIKCHVEQLLLHCYSSIVFPLPWDFFYIKNKNVPTLFWGNRANTATSLEVLCFISVLFDEQCSVPQVIKLHYGYKFPGNRILFNSSCIKLMSLHIDPRDTTAGLGWMPSHAYVENMDERLKQTRPLHKSFWVKFLNNRLVN